MAKKFKIHNFVKIIKPNFSVEQIECSRFEALERSKSVGNLSKSGRPTILKPLKLWRPGADGKKRMLWVYGNPWEGGPRYLRTHRLGKQIKIEEQKLKLTFQWSYVAHP